MIQNSCDVGKLNNGHLEGDSLAKEFLGFLKLDTLLSALMKEACVKSLCKQEAVCDVLCVLGLANYEINWQEDGMLESAEHRYTSTERLRDITETVSFKALV